MLDFPPLLSPFYTPCLAHPTTLAANRLCVNAFPSATEHRDVSLLSWGNLPLSQTLLLSFLMSY